MKVTRVLLPSLLLVAIIVLGLGRHVLSPRAQTTDTTGAACCGGEAPRQLEFPYYSLRDGFTATLLLVSDSPKPVDFVLALHSRSGQTVLAPGMTIQPQEKLPIQLGTLLADLAADVTGDFSEGSVSIYFTGTIMPLAGQLTMTNPSKSLSLESEMVDNSPGLGLLPPVLNAVWWGLGGGREAEIMVTNTSGDPAIADLFLDFLGKRHENAPLLFAPHETKVLSISQLLGNLKASPAQAPEGGITIIQQGSKPALIAQGKITDPAAGFSTSLNFMDPALQKASALHASGVPVGLPSGDSPYAGIGLFVPHIIVRNLIGSPQSVTITVEYPGKKQAQQTPLPTLALGPYATADVALDSASAILPLPLPYCSIRIQYSGPPGSVVGEVSSVESKGDLVIDSRLANEGDGWAGSGAHPWHLDDETQSILFLTNMGNDSADIGFQVQARGVHYHVTNLSLSAHETRSIDLRTLRDAQKPDFKGNKIPREAEDGSVVWVRLKGIPVMGRLVVLRRKKGVASNYDCSTCYCSASYVDCEISPEPPSCIGPNTLMQLTCIGDYASCNGTHYYYDRTGPATWTSSNPSVASFDSTTRRGLVRAHLAGYAYVTASYTGTKYPSISPCVPTFWTDSYTSPVYVVNSGCPDHTRIISDTDAAQTCIPSYIVNARRLVTYEVLDALGNPVGSITDPLFLAEGITFLTHNNCGNPDPPSQSFGPIAGSRFTDQLRVNCPPNPSLDCGFSVDATWASSPLFQFAPAIIMTLRGEVVHTGYTTVLGVTLTPRTTDYILPGTCVYADGHTANQGSPGCP